MPIRERVIETYLREQVKKMGGRAIKLTSSSLRGLPDRICVFPGPYTCFVEVKAPNRKPSDKQVRLIQWLKRLGYEAVVIDSRPRVDSFLRWVKENRL
jgi:hypothetical protein